MSIPWSRFPAYIVIMFLSAILVSASGCALLFMRVQVGAGPAGYPLSAPRNMSSQPDHPLNQLREIDSLYRDRPSRSLPFISRFGFRWAKNNFWFLREMSVHAQDEVYFLPDERVFAFYRSGDHLVGKLGPDGYREGAEIIAGFPDPMDPLWLFIGSPLEERDASFWLHTDSCYVLVNLGNRTVQTFDADQVLYAQYHKSLAPDEPTDGLPLSVQVLSVQVLATSREFQVKMADRSFGGIRSIRGTFPDSFTAPPTRVRISSRGDTLAFAFRQDSTHDAWHIYNNLGLVQDCFSETGIAVRSTRPPRPGAFDFIRPALECHAFLPFPFPLAMIATLAANSQWSVTHELKGKLPSLLRYLLALLFFAHLAGGIAGGFSALLCTRDRPRAVRWGLAGLAVGLPILAILAYDLAKAEGVPCPRCNRRRRTPPGCSHCGHVELLAVPLVKGASTTPSSRGSA